MVKSYKIGIILYYLKYNADETCRYEGFFTKDKTD